MPDKSTDRMPVPSEAGPVEEETKGIVLSAAEQAVLENIAGGDWKKYGRVAMAALSALPWVGSIVGAAAALSAEHDQGKTNKLIALWIQEHEIKFRELVETLQSVFARLDAFGDQIQSRIESEEYLKLVRQTFRTWDSAETREKKDMLRKLITNAGGVTIVQDDIVRLFIEFLEKFHELHFAVIREVHAHPRITRAEIWENLASGGDRPREDSSKADLFKLLIHELSTGYVIRQARETDPAGNWVRRPTGRRTSGSNLQSAFEATKEYVLTELGTEFVHYVMEDLVPQLQASTSTERAGE